MSPESRKLASSYFVVLTFFLGCQNQFSEAPARVLAPVERDAAAALKAMGADPEMNDDGHIWKITARGTSIDDEALKHAAACSQLEILDLTGTNVTDIGLKHLAGLQRLRNLELQGTQITDAGLAILSQLPSLWVLDLRATRISDVGLSQLTQYPKLEHLSVGGKSDRSFSVNFGVDGRPTTQPNVGEDRESRETLTDKGAVSLSHLRNLTSLTISGAQMTGEGASGLSELTKLDWLSIEQCNIGDALEFVSRLKKLKHLWLEEIGMTDAGLRHLMGLKNLEWLSCGRNPGITDVAMPRFAEFPQLETLSLTRTSITNAGLPKLKPAKSLECLFLRETAVTREAADALRRRLPRLSLIETDR